MDPMMLGPFGPGALSNKNFELLYCRLSIASVQNGRELILNDHQNYGHKPWPSLIDEIAARTPGRPFVSLPRSQYLEDGFPDITIGDLARAANRCSWWILQELKRSRSFETLTYIGPQDICYIIMLLAAAKTAYQVRFYCGDFDQGWQDENSLCFILRRLWGHISRFWNRQDAEFIFNQETLLR